MTMEIVTFRVMPGTTVDEVRSASAGVQEFLAGCPGFEKRELFHDGESGQWVDTVRWVDRPSALDAGERIMASACAASFLALIDEASVVMHHLEAV